MEHTPESDESSGDDPIIYFTLIDFLIQIIFCAVFAFVVFQSVQKAREAKLPGWVRDPVYLPLIRDMTPFITMKNEKQIQELLKMLKEQGALEQFLKFLRESKDPFTLMDQCLRYPDACHRFGSLTSSEIGRFMGGVGLPPCLRTMDRLFDADVFDDHIVVLRISQVGRAVLAENGVALEEGDVIAKEDVVARLRALGRPDCRHYVTYIKQGDSEDMRYTIERVLRPDIRRPRPGRR